MSIEELQKELEKEKARRLAAEAKIVSLNHEIDAFQKVLLLRSHNSAPISLESDAILSSLISSLQDGIVIEDELGSVTRANDIFCQQFGINETAETLYGADYLHIAERGKHLFRYPETFVARIGELSREKRAVLNEPLLLEDGNVITMDYVPLFADGKYMGNVWKYTYTGIDKEVALQLESQKKFYEQILDHIPADIAVFNKDQKYVYVNPITIPDEELRKWVIGKNDDEYCLRTGKPNSIAEGRKKLLNKIKSSKKQTEWEEKIKKTGGAIEYHLKKMTPITDKSGNVDMIIAYGTDISDLKKTEENLKLSDKRYREIFSFSQAWICTHNMNGVLLTINPAACDILGYDEKELIGRRIDELIPEKLRVGFHINYLEQIKTEGRSEGIMNILNKDGRNIYLLYQNYQVNEPGYEPYVIGFAQNITDRLKAEDALKRSEEKYRGIIENMNLGMLELDSDEQIMYANQRFCIMSGYTQAELISQNAKKMFLDNGYTRNISEKMLKRQFSIANSYELAVKNKKEEAKWWLVSNAPLYNEDGTLKGSVSIHLDITRQKKMEHQLRDAKLEAERSSDAKEMFLTNMSHEIRTPINAIMGLGKLLGKSGLDEQQQYYLSSIRAASENLLVIINDILDLSKIEAGKIAIESMSFDLKKIAAQAINMLTHKAEEKGLIIAHELDKRIAPKLIGDPYRINQVLINMLSNAIKFTEKGSVELNATVVEGDEAYQKILVTIKDTGVGISEDFLKSIFKKFTQEDETVARKFGGTGLGMSITKQLMELMDGSIDITSKKGAGTLVSLEFKLKIGTEKVLEKKRAINKVDTGNIKDARILLVEDNELNRLLAYTILKQFGANVSEAENGAIAVDMMKKEAFDLILMDVQMPVMDGITATQIIRKDISATIPIIALTANAIKGRREQYLQSGMNDCMTKPYDEEKMITLISHWLSNAAGLKYAPIAPRLETPAAKKDTGYLGYFETTPMKEKKPPPEVANNEPLYDIKKLMGVGGGNNDFVMQMLKLFVKNTPESAQKIKEAYQSGDYETVKYLAHLIRPSLHNMSVNSIKNDVLKIESLAEKAEKNPALETLIEKLITVVSKTVAQIKKEHKL